MSTTQTLTAIHIPTPLRAFTGNQATVEVAGETVREALADLVARHPALKHHLFDEAGRLRSFVNVYVGDEDIRYLDGPATALKPGDTLSIVPSIAGGRG
ncbi:MAG: MoaD/ThiS family protein [Bacteroidetes bacterium]|nr:MAG: MoaD/ThiS family protein [Bacteroidota bacterium]GIV58159.1 MAG: molybdenum cofactor biosynthesis protein MoaD [Rhodothermaceae bacterium]